MLSRNSWRPVAFELVTTAVKPSASRKENHSGAVGHADVRAWLGRALGAYERTIEVRGVSAVGERDGIHRYDVFAHLEGTFPGGTVDLTFQFGLRDGRVVSLLIVPTEEVTT
jgi:hypothetical protein